MTQTTSPKNKLKQETKFGKNSVVCRYPSRYNLLSEDKKKKEKKKRKIRLKHPTSTRVEKKHKKGFKKVKRTGK